MAEPLQAVAFDATGTLLYPDPPMGAVYARIGADYGSRLDAGMIEANFADAWQRMRRRRRADPRHLASSEALERAMWRRLVSESLSDMPEAHLDACLARLWAWFAEPTSWRLYDDVEPALRRLRTAGYRLAVVSNFDSRLYGLCEGLGLGAHLQCIVTSAEAGWQKPAAAIFHTAAARLGCSERDVLMVGDSYTADVLGARAAGMSAVWLRRHAPADLPAPTVRSLQELAARLT